MSNQIIFNCLQIGINAGLLWQIFAVRKSMDDRFDLVAQHLDERPR